MSQLPRLSGRELVKALCKVGFELKRQHVLPQMEME